MFMLSTLFMSVRMPLRSAFDVLCLWSYQFNLKSSTDIVCKEFMKLIRWLHTLPIKRS